MGKQKGIVKLKGTLGDFSFYKGQDGNLARKKSGIDAKRVNSDPRFQRTRENNKEFSEAIKAVNLLQTAFREVLLGIGVREYRAKLLQEMLKVIRTDTVHAKGERKVKNGDIELLQGFEFNPYSSFNKVFHSLYNIELYEFEENEWYVEYYTLSAFAPVNVFAAPAGATHYRILSAGGQIDFESGTHTVETRSDLEEIPLNNDLAVLGNAYRLENDQPVFLMFRPIFYQEMNGRFYELRIKGYNAASLLFVKKAVEYGRVLG